MNFINNWLRPITLDAGANTTALDLHDGTYRLTLSNAERTAFEYVDAVVSAGTAQIARGLEGSAAQAWPTGSVIYCSITAGQLSTMMGLIEQLESRVAALEQGAPAGALVDADGLALIDADRSYLTVGE